MEIHWKEDGASILRQDTNVNLHHSPIVSNAGIGGAEMNINSRNLNPNMGGPAAGQTVVVHEAGHIIGLDHPGTGQVSRRTGQILENTDRESYTWAGTRSDGVIVNGAVDIMGAGSSFFGYHFQSWADELDDAYSECANHRIR